MITKQKEKEMSTHTTHDKPVEQGKKEKPEKGKYIYTYLYIFVLFQLFYFLYYFNYTIINKYFYIKYYLTCCFFQRKQLKKGKL